MEFLSRDLTKRYGRFTALDSFNLSIDKGECVALLGPNGAGKSTLLKIATNVIHPTNGSVEIGGINVQENPMRSLEHVGPLVELPEFYPYLTGREILNYVLKVKGADREMINSETSRLSDLLRMVFFVDKKCGYYSRGMKQRLALSCALAMDPYMLILDEPTFGLDPRGMREFVEIIRKINVKDGKTILLSTHLISEAREIANRVVILNDGKNLAEIKNERETNLMNITLYEDFERNKEQFDFIKIISANGKNLTLMVEENHSNDEVINEFTKKGYRIRWVEPTNQIEKKYMELIR